MNLIKDYSSFKKTSYYGKSFFDVIKKEDIDLLISIQKNYLLMNVIYELEHIFQKIPELDSFKLIYNIPTFTLDGKLTSKDSVVKIELSPVYTKEITENSRKINKSYISDSFNNNTIFPCIRSAFNKNWSNALLELFEEPGMSNKENRLNTYFTYINKLNLIDELTKLFKEYIQGIVQNKFKPTLLIKLDESNIIPFFEINYSEALKNQKLIEDKTELLITFYNEQTIINIMKMFDKKDADFIYFQNKFPVYYKKGESIYNYLFDNLEKISDIQFQDFIAYTKNSNDLFNLSENPKCISEEFRQRIIVEQINKEKSHIFNTINNNLYTNKIRNRI